MTLDAIDEGSAVFIDANIFIYHFTGASPQCTNLLTRCESGGLRGATSALVLAETCHRLMTIEAVRRKLVSPKNRVAKLSRRPELVSQLSDYEASIEAIPSMRIEIVALTAATIGQGLRLQRRYGVLTNDSLLVAGMLQAGFQLLATADRGLSAVSEVEIALPTDLGLE